MKITKDDMDQICRKDDLKGLSTLANMVNPNKKGTRICLNCDKPFESEDMIHFRLCKKCRRG